MFKHLEKHFTSVKLIVLIFENAKEFCSSLLQTAGAFHIFHHCTYSVSSCVGYVCVCVDADIIVYMRLFF